MKLIRVFMKCVCCMRKHSRIHYVSSMQAKVRWEYVWSYKNSESRVEQQLRSVLLEYAVKPYLMQLEGSKVDTRVLAVDNLIIWTGTLVFLYHALLVVIEKHFEEYLNKLKKRMAPDDPYLQNVHHRYWMTFISCAIQKSNATIIYNPRQSEARQAINININY